MMGERRILKILKQADMHNICCENCHSNDQKENHVKIAYKQTSATANSLPSEEKYNLPARLCP
jgi:hypothetical protein